MRRYYSHLTKVIVLENFLLKIMSTCISTLFNFLNLNVRKNNYLYVIYDSDPRNSSLL